MRMTCTIPCIVGLSLIVCSLAGCAGVGTLEESLEAVVAGASDLTSLDEALSDEATNEDVTADATRLRASDEVLPVSDQLAAVGEQRPGPLAGERPRRESQQPPEDPLELTDEQRELAQEIFASAHEEIELLREEARAQTEALLTEEQLALLEEMHAGQGEGPPPRPPRPFCCGSQEPPEPEDNGELPPPIARLAELVDLTDEQIEAILAIHAETRVAMDVVRDDACAQFRALLTEEQLTILDELLPPPPRGPGNGAGGGPGGPPWDGEAAPPPDGEGGRPPGGPVGR